MKKAILPMVILLVAASLMALESAPSDVVGFVKVPCGVGFTPFALPFTYVDGTGASSMLLQDVVGPYMTGGMAFNADKVWDITSAETSYKTLAGTFSGFQAFNYTHAYYMENKHSAFDLYLTGKVESEILDFGEMAMGFNPVGIKEAGEVSLNDIDILSAGFTGGMAFNSDKIWDMTAAQTSYYNTTTSAWVGFTTLTPGHAYYVEVKNTPFTWVYDPMSRDRGDATFETHNVNNSKRR